MCCVQYMVVYQCIVAEANTAAFVLDGSSLSNLQVCCSKRSQQHACTRLCISCTTMVSLIDTSQCAYCNTEAIILLSSKLLSPCCYIYIYHAYPSQPPLPHHLQIKSPLPHMTHPAPQGPTQTPMPLIQPKCSQQASCGAAEWHH